MKTFLRQGCWDIYRREWRDLGRWAGCVQKEIDQRIADALRESFYRTTRGVVSPTLALPDFSTIGDPFDGTSPEPWLGLVAGGLLAAAFGFVPALVGAVVGFIVGLVIGKAGRRKREIDQIIKRMRERSPETVDTMVSQLAQNIQRLEQKWNQGIEDRLVSYANDLQRELLESGTPVSQEEERIITQSMERLNPLVQKIEELRANLESICSQ